MGGIRIGGIVAAATMIFFLATAIAGDVFEPYENARFGTIADIPETHVPQPEPENGDGRRFVAEDGRSEIAVYAGHNALGQGLAELMAEAVSGMSAVEETRISGNRLTVSGMRDGRGVIHGALIDARDVIHVAEVTFDGPISPLLRERLVYVVESLRVSRSVAREPPGGYHVPARGSKERAAIMDAARGPVSRDIGQTVIFVVVTLRSDGQWAYLEARPANPDGSRLDWRRTNLAADWEAGMLGDTVMVLLRRDGGAWRAVEHIIGPTDVFWYGWVDQYGLPESLFKDD